MKGICLLAVLALALSLAPGVCGAYRFPYVAVFGDTLGGQGGAEHAVCAIGYIPVPYTTVEMWVWVLPDPAKGMSACEFKLRYPSSTYITQGAVTSNPINQAEVGSLSAGISVSLGAANCQYDWYWTHRQELVVKGFAARVIWFEGHPVNGGHIYVADCSPGFPVSDATVLVCLALNSNICGCTDATREATWGTIKSLYIK